ncbi:hypothetical protein OTU49_011327 [Cherax quadricarinatus]|uniref:Protein SON n=1 Tax=Cherax quadricarinatus TaxID=27406 RepID=A0AAW0W4F8_CHEQU
MGDVESNKTSDEIINELFSSLNVPLSPKLCEIEEKYAKNEVINIGDSENSDDFPVNFDEESDSLSSESDEEAKGASSVVQDETQDGKNEKRKSTKKKKDKKKKKKKRRKKGDGGRHKHKKRKKKEGSETLEDEQLSVSILQDIKVRNQALIEKIMVQEEIKKAQLSDVKDKNRKMSDGKERDKIMSDGKEKGKSMLDAKEESKSILDAQEKNKNMLDVKEKDKIMLDIKEKDKNACMSDIKKKNIPDVKEKEKNIYLKEKDSVSDIKEKDKNVLNVKEKDKGMSDVKEKDKGMSDIKEKDKGVSDVKEKDKGMSIVKEKDKGMSIVKEKDKGMSDLKEKGKNMLDVKDKDNMSAVKEKHKNISHSKSPKLNDNSSGGAEADTKKIVSISISDVDSKGELQGKLSKSDETATSKSKSPALPISNSLNNVHLKSESLCGGRRKYSESRSRSRSRGSKCSRSRSKSKCYQNKSRTRSPIVSESNKRSSPVSRSLTPRGTKKLRSSKSGSRSSSRRRSRSRSEGNSRSRSRRNSNSRSRRNSGSRSRRNSGSRSRRNSSSRSRRNSGSRSRRNSNSRSRRNSRSRSHRKSRSRSRRKSRSRSHRKSRSRSHKRSISKSHRSKSRSPKRSSFSKEKFDLFDKLRQNSNKITELKGSNDQNNDSKTTPSPGIGLKIQNGSGGVIALDSIPLPIPPSTLPDPRSIPLPQPVTLDDSLKESRTTNGVDLDLKAIPIPSQSGDSPSKEQDSCKTKDGNKIKQDEGSDKAKTKTIIIKSLKDSLVFLQAQEEAERRAKEIAENQENSTEETEKKSDTGVEDKEEVEERETSEEKNHVEDTEEKEVLEVKNDLVEKKVVVKEKREEIEIKEEVVASNTDKKIDSVETKKDEVLDNVDVEKNEEQKVDDTANGMEEGEIASEDEESEGKCSSKPHSKKKAKKNKNKSKEKRKSRKDKEKTKDEKKKGPERSKSRERDRTRSRSRDKHKSRRHSSNSRNKDRDYDRRHRRHSRSRSRGRSSRLHHKTYSRSRSRSKSRSRRKRDPTSDLRDKVTRKRLLEIARRNAVYLMQNGCLPPSVEQEQLVKIKAGGKSVDELTDFCKQLVASGNYSDVDLSDPSLSSGDDRDNPDKPFSNTRHPFSVRDTKPILMNIRNAPMLPTKTNAERLAGQAKLREQFPVSSGSQHRTKGELTSSEGKHQTESDWVPVPPKEKKEEDKVFPQTEVQAVDISQIVSTRLSAMRKLQDNPHDSEAIKTLHNVQKEMQNWALSKQEPGQFTGTTGVKVLSQEELSAGHQAWARKEQFKEAAPVRPQFGLKMLQKMGWSPGEGLGKNKEGTIEPLLLDVKMDKKGFHAQEELTPKKQPIPLAKDLSGKHPVSALVELCSKRKWSPPDFEMVFDCGPDHKKNFLMKVMVNGQEFKPSVAASTKKMAKANAAAAYLQSLGLFPKDPNNPLL